MAGYNLTYGEYRSSSISEEDIWKIMNRVFSSKTRNTTSYKFCFMKALLDNLFNVDSSLTIDFDRIFYKFAEMYWNLVVLYKTRQVNNGFENSGVEGVIHKYLLNEHLSARFESIKDEFKLKIVSEIKRVGKRYVVGATYSDLDQVGYSFSLEKENLQFNPAFYTFLVKYKGVLERLNYYEWIKYLEKVNPEENAYSLANKLELSTKRKNLLVYKNVLYGSAGYHTCFYCNKELSDIQVDIDHYIPWSFVKDDQIWNFVISCKTCNNGKRAKIPCDDYLEPLFDQNRRVSLMLLGQENLEKQMKRYNTNLFIGIKNSALFNGYECNWVPKHKF